MDTITIEITQNIGFGANQEFVLVPGTRLPALPGDETFKLFVLVAGQRIGILSGEYVAV